MDFNECRMLRNGGQFVGIEWAFRRRKCLCCYVFRIADSATCSSAGATQDHCRDLWADVKVVPGQEENL